MAKRKQQSRKVRKSWFDEHWDEAALLIGFIIAILLILKGSGVI
jgi:hypothetical protein